MSKTITLISEKTVFNRVLQIQEAKLITENEQGPFNFSRTRINRQDAAAVLVLEEDTDLFVFTKQYRYAVADRVEDQLLEMVAGKVDEGEDAFQTAIRETEEEIGYVIDPGQLIKINSFFASPGYTSEKYHLYFAAVNSSQKRSEGGGVLTENEFISTIKIPRSVFLHDIKTGKIDDAKTYVAGLWFLLNVNS